MQLTFPSNRPSRPPGALRTLRDIISNQHHSFSLTGGAAKAMFSVKVTIKAMFAVKVTTKYWEHTLHGHAVTVLLTVALLVVVVLARTRMELVPLMNSVVAEVADTTMVADTMFNGGRCVYLY
jgi:hypothetical protein